MLGRGLCQWSFLAVFEMKEGGCLQVSLAKTFSKLRRDGIGVLSRPSLLIGLRPVRMAVAYSRKSRYSGFLYQIIQSGNLNLGFFSVMTADVVFGWSSEPSMSYQTCLPCVRGLKLEYKSASRMRKRKETERTETRESLAVVRFPDAMVHDIRFSPLSS